MADAITLIAAMRAQEPVAQIGKEPDYWSRGHFYEGKKNKLYELSSLDNIKAGTLLYTRDPAALDALAAEVERLTRENHNLRWALGEPGFEQMATPEEQAESDAAVAQSNALLSRMAERKARFDSLVPAGADLLEHLETVTRELAEARADAERLRTTLERIADWDSSWGPYPENNAEWRAMVVVTAREATRPVAAKEQSNG